MSYKTIIFCVIFFTNYNCEADIFSDYTEKCSIRDGECQKDVLTAMLRDGDKKGFPELGIPPLDPYQVNHTTVSILGMMQLTMTEGQVEGTTNCSFTKFESNFDKRYTYTESFCDHIKISGHYKIEVGSLAQALIGNPVSGDGFGTIEIDKMVLKMKIPYSVNELEDQEIHLLPEISEAEYSTNDIENVKFNATNVFVGGREISEPLVNFMNKSWRMINRSFGKIFSDKVMEVFYIYLEDFFIKVPAKILVSDDLSPYVKS